MGTKDFWAEREINRKKEEDRCRRIFEREGKNYSYSRSEVSILRSLNLIKPKK